MRSIVIYLSVIVALYSIPSHSSEIHDAAGDGDLQKVTELITEHPELVHETTESGNTPLHFACSGENPELVTLLIVRGANVNALNGSHLTPLHYAAYCNRPTNIELLVEHKARIESADREQQTPLHAAASSNADAAVKALLERGADVSARNEYERTPFVLAARECGNIDIAKLLLTRGADIDAVDRTGKGALDLAAWRGFNQFVDFILERGVKIPDSEARRLDLLSHCMQRRLEKLLAALLEADLDLKKISAGNPSLILAAASGGSTEIMDVLGRKGFDFNYADRNGWTPLHCAAEFGRNDAVTFLLDNGARINARTVMGQSAFNIAREGDNSETADLLVKRGAETGMPRFPNLQRTYLGQEKPGTTPVPFAPGIVIAHYDLHSSVTFSPDGDMAFWTVMVPPRESGYGRNRILGTSLENGKWTYPLPPEFQGSEPIFAPDGKRLYFLSREPLDKDTPSSKENIWYVEHTKSGWSKPQPVDPVINSAPLHWQFSIDRNGTFYMGSGDGRILVSGTSDGRYQPPVDFAELHENSSVRGGCPYISPDGDYLIFTRDGDLHVTFRTVDGTWTVAEELGEPVNSADDDLCPLVSPDGEYLFFITIKDGEWGPHWVAIKSRLKDLRTKGRLQAVAGRHLDRRGPVDK